MTESRRLGLEAPNRRAKLLQNQAVRERLLVLCLIDGGRLTEGLRYMFNGNNFHASIN